MKISIIVVFVIAILITIIYQLYIQKKEKEIANKATVLLYEEKYDEFDKFMDTNETKKSLRRYNYNYLKLNEAIKQNNKVAITNALNNFDYIHMSIKQASTLYSNMFTYYVEINDLKGADDIYKKILNIKNYPHMNEISRLYDIHVKKGYTYLEDTIEELKTVDKNNIPILESLISLMYKNKGDLQNASLYDDLSNKHMKEIIDKV